MTKAVKKQTTKATPAKAKPVAKAKAPKTASKVVTENPLASLGMTTSQKIRELAAAGVAKAEIAKQLDIRYQHVRNVLTVPLKRPVKTLADVTPKAKKAKA